MEGTPNTFPLLMPVRPLIWYRLGSRQYAWMIVCTPAQRPIEVRIVYVGDELVDSRVNLEYQVGAVTDIRTLFSKTDFELKTVHATRATEDTSKSLP